MDFTASLIRHCLRLGEFVDHFSFLMLSSKCIKASMALNLFTKGVISCEILLYISLS